MAYIFFEFLYHLMSLDLGWILQFVYDNLFWVFALMAVSFFILEGKRTLSYFFILVFVVWITFDFPILIGWTFYIAPILGLLYVIRLAVITIAEHDVVLQQYLRVLWVALWWIILIWVNAVFKIV